jgi:aminoglycoside/choline kinase family phosphotransferase
MTTTVFDGLDLDARIRRFIASELPGYHAARVVVLTGDASDRRYVRLAAAAGASIVLMIHAAPIEFAALPFATVRDLLARVPLPVPAILAHSDALGIVALEDLGDVTLQAHLGAADPAERDARYREAIGLVAELQRRGAELADPRSLPYTVRFDVEKLTWELDFFVRHFLEGAKGLTFSAAERAALADEWRRLVDDLAAEPAVVCHRDYHSRNLMVHGGRLWMIDFQDARLGPDTYDLVSLLRDSYVGLSAGEVDRFVDHFLALKGPAADPPARFRERFDTMALQRNLKALGTFGYQSVARGNPVYLQYVPRTLAYARETLRRRERFARLADLLARHVPELA